MDRWHRQFQEFLNSNSWKSIIEYSDNIDLSNYEDDESKWEASRFQKITVYLQNTLDLIDPHFVDLDQYNQISLETDRCINYVNRSSHKIREANNHLSNILKIVQSFQMNSTHLEASSEAFRKYDELVSARLPSKQKELRDITKSIKNALKLIITFDKEGSTKGEENTINEKLEDFFENIKIQKEKIELSYKELIINDDSIRAKLNQTKVDAEKTLEEIKEQFEKHEKYHVELIDYRDIVFGYKTDDGDEFEGLRDAIENTRGAIKEYHREQDEIHKKLKDEIESLLHGATSAGLSVAYSTLKDRAQDLVNYNFIGFLCSVGALLGFLIWSFYAFPLTDNSLETWLVSYLYRLPIITTFVWLAFFFAKRRSEQERLKQEYAHKESLSRSYESYRKQINDLGEQQSDLLPHLIKTAIDTIGYNAAKTLDKKHSGDHPSIIDSTNSDKS